jgi:hypothetical protein
MYVFIAILLLIGLAQGIHAYVQWRAEERERAV